MHHIIQTIYTLSNAVSKFETIKIAISISIIGHANGISRWVKNYHTLKDTDLHSAGAEIELVTTNPALVIFFSMVFA